MEIPYRRSHLLLRPEYDAEDDIAQRGLLNCFRGFTEGEPTDFAFFFFRPVRSLVFYFQGKDLHLANHNSSIRQTLRIREGPYRIFASFSHDARFLKSFARSGGMRSFPRYRPALWNDPAPRVARSYKHHLHTRMQVVPER